MADSQPGPVTRPTSGVSIFARLARPLHPQPTGVAPRLAPLNEVRVVVFDLYGTLLVSGSGDVGTADPAERYLAMRDALAAVGIGGPDAAAGFVAQLQTQIHRHHVRAISRGVEKPEVDIVEIWRRCLMELGYGTLARDPRLPQQLSAEFEARANPTWPMPGARRTVAALAERGYGLGIVSNAQQFTLDVMRLHFGTNLRQVGFHNDLSLLSNRFGHAKPGRRLFDCLCQALRDQGWQPEQAVYVGNDMLNDVWAAQRAGLRTALFAGDARSLRWRESEPAVRETRADVVLSELPQLLACLVA